MSLSRRNPRRDANEAAIAAGLRLVGALVWRVSGKGLPDLLVYFGGHYFAMEIKTARGRLTVAQRGPWPIVRTLAEALDVIGLRGRIGITPTRPQ